MDNIGFHMSTKDMGFLGALKFVDFVGGNCMQVFMRSQRNDYEKFISSKDVLESKKFIDERNFLLVGHSMINLAKSFDKSDSGLDLLVLDLKKINFLGGLGVVVHIGDFDDKDYLPYENIRRNVVDVLKNSPSNVKIIFENVSGQRRESGFRFDELKYVYDLFDAKYKERIGFVIDTCHSHAGGYDLSETSGVKFWIDEVERNIGWERVLFVHLNDSYGGLGSRLDRHADLGFGSIGVEGLREITSYLRSIGVPVVLETPKVNSTIFEQIELVKSWI